MANTISILIKAQDNSKAVLDAAAANYEAAGKRISAVGSGMMDAGKAATAGLTVPILAAGAAAIKMAGNFEQSLNILQSVSGATADQMAALRKQAVDLGNDITLPGISSTGAAAAMTELAKAGLSVNDVMAASHGVLALATAGQIDVSSAAMTTARALNAFGLSGDQANKISDLLAASANASTASVSDMALGLQMAGAQSHQMKVSLQDTVTALALFSNAGINGSDAGTSLKQMFIQLATPTEQATTLMNQLGLKFFDAKGNFIGLSASAGMMQDKLKGLTVEQKNYTLATIFGSDATRVASILTDSGAAGFDKMSVAVNKQGAAADLAAAQNSGFNGALDNLKSTIETSATNLGSKLLPVLTRNIKGMADEVGRLTDWFDGLSEGQQDMIIKTLGYTAALGPALLVTGKMVKTVGSLVSAATAVSKAFGLFKTTKLVSEATLASTALGTTGMAGAAGEGAAALAGSGGLLALLGPVAVGVAAVGIAAGGAYLLWQKFNDQSDRYGATSGSGIGARTKGAVDAVTLAQMAQGDAVKAVQKANADSTAAQAKLVDSQKQVKQANDDVTASQNNVKTALDQFGANSPQYQQAVSDLATKNADLNQKLADNAWANLTVVDASGKARDALEKQKDATWNLNQLLYGTVDAIAQFGPKALEQLGGIQVLQGAIQGLSIQWDGFYTDVQSQNIQVNNILFGLGSTIGQVQGQSEKVNSTLRAAAGSAITIQSSVGSIQGGKGAIQGHALGTGFAPGGITALGEQGIEIVASPTVANLKPGSKVYNTKDTQSMMGGSKSFVIQNLNVNNNVDVNAVIRRLGWKLANV